MQGTDDIGVIEDMTGWQLFSRTYVDALAKSVK